MPGAIKEAVAQYRKDEDVIAHFLDECTETGIGCTAQRSAVFKAYRFWALESNYHPLGRNRFFTRIKDRGLHTDKKAKGEFYQGFKLKPLMY